MAIVEGLRESVKDASEALEVDPTQVMTMVLMTQYYDMLTDVGRNSQLNTVMIPHSPGAVDDIRNQIIAAMKASQNQST